MIRKLAEIGPRAPKGVPRGGAQYSQGFSQVKRREKVRKSRRLSRVFPGFPREALLVFPAAAGVLVDHEPQDEADQRNADQDQGIYRVHEKSSENAARPTG